MARQINVKRSCIGHLDNVVETVSQPQMEVTLPGDAGVEVACSVDTTHGRVVGLTTAWQSTWQRARQPRAGQHHGLVMVTVVLGACDEATVTNTHVTLVRERGEVRVVLVTDLGRGVFC